MRTRDCDCGAYGWIKTDREVEPCMRVRAVSMMQKMKVSCISRVSLVRCRSDDARRDGVDASRETEVDERTRSTKTKRIQPRDRRDAMAREW